MTFKKLISFFRNDGKATPFEYVDTKLAALNKEMGIIG